MDEWHREALGLLGEGTARRAGLVVVVVVVLVVGVVVVPGEVVVVLLVDMVVGNVVVLVVVGVGGLVVAGVVTGVVLLLVERGCIGTERSEKIRILRQFSDATKEAGRGARAYAATENEENPN